MKAFDSKEFYPLHLRVIFYLLLIALVAGVFTLVVRLPVRVPPEGAEVTVAKDIANIPPGHGRPVVAANPEGHPRPYEPACLTESIRGTLRRHETVSDLFLDQGLSHELVHAVNLSAQPVFDLRHVRAGQSYTLARIGTTFCHFTYEIDPERYLLIASGDDGFFSEIREYPFYARVDSLVGIIDHSLFLTVLESGEGPELALELSEIFAWDIDFFLDIRKGDGFRIFFERKCLGDSMVCYGRILAADFVVQGVSHRAFYFSDATGYDDYYGPGGQSLRKALLKAPLRYSRISSSFSYRRFHPVHRHYAPHLGIDYAAPKGTPVQTTGGGTVIFAARSGANGNMVEVRHNETYTTYYLHLSKFAKGIKKGRQVSQGDVIGYVGDTGTATGPHLDYRIKKHGTFVNPRKVDLPAAEPVAEAFRPQFEELRDRWVKRLERLGVESGRDVAFSTPGG